MRNVLILCTGNSCRSIMAEALINHDLGDECDIKAYSAGVSAKGEVNPNALRVLKEAGIDTFGLASKNLDAVQNISFDLVVTVCDNAKESCPIFPGRAKVIHVGFADPDGKEYEAFVDTLNEIRNRLLPVIKKELC